MVSNSASTRATDVIEHSTAPASEENVAQAEGTRSVVATKGELVAKPSAKSRDAETAKDTMKPRSFLEFPAEIKNMIYEFVVDNATANIVWTPGNANITTFLKPYAGLTRVCKQIRHEFHPLHEEQRSVCIGIQDLEKYIATFLSTDLKVLEEYRGTLTINIDGFTPGNTAGVDVLPLIKLARSVPEYVWKLVSHSPLTTPALVDEFRGILAHALTSEQWGKHLNTNATRDLPSCYTAGVISRVVYHRRSPAQPTADPFLEVFFSDAHQQPYWMLFDTNTTRNRIGLCRFLWQLEMDQLTELDVKVGKSMWLRNVTPTSGR